MSHIKLLSPSTLYNTSPYYAPISMTSSRHGPTTTIRTAGQVGRSVSGTIPATYEAQVDLAFSNLSECLNAASASVRDVVKLTYYIVGYDEAKRYHAKVLLEWLKGHMPPATLVPVMGLARKEFLFEIEAVAVVRDLKACEAVARPLPGTALTVDVVVIGAGLSGLQAAYNIQRSGLSCIVLEARDRVGGKTWSKPTKNGGVVDLGAAWINDSNQSRMYALAKRFGLHCIEQLTDGLCVAHVPGEEALRFRYGEVPGFSEEERANIVMIRDLVEEVCHTIDIRNPSEPHFDSLTLEQFVKEKGAGEKALASVSVWTRAMLGCEPSEVSALYFLDYCKSGGGLMRMRSDQKNGGQYLRIRSGTQSFSTKIAEEMIPGSVLLEAPVSRVSQNSTGAVVVTEDDTKYHCKRVIVSVPTPSYKNIRFSPPLPLDKQKYSSNSILGYYAKLILVWEEHWWKDLGFCGMAQSFIGPAAVIRDTSDPETGVFSLTCFVTGEPGRQWSKLDDASRKEAVLCQLEELYGMANSKTIRSPIEVFEQEWTKDAWSQGCPCPFTPPNLMTEVGAALRAPYGALHFAGTETSFEWKGYMEGAVRAGERGADEVVSALAEKGGFSAKL